MPWEDCLEWRFRRAKNQYLKAKENVKSQPDIAIFLLLSCAEILELVDKKHSWKNVKEFYKETPKNLRVSPLNYRNSVKKWEKLKQLPFEETIYVLWKYFRNPFTHGGFASASPTKMKEIETVAMYINFTSLDFQSHNNEKVYYSVDTIKLVNWLENITKETLKKLAKKTLLEGPFKTDLLKSGL